MMTSRLTADPSESRERPTWWLLIGVISMLFASRNTHAQLSVSFGASSTLEAGQAGQTLDLLISNNTGSPGTVYPVIQVLLELQVDDGTAGPLITGVDLKAPGTLFESDIGSALSGGALNPPPNMWEVGLITHNDSFDRPTAYSFSPGQTVTLARITFNTTSIPPQTTWNLAVNDANGISHFSYLTNPGNPNDKASTTVDFSSFNGTITVVPEPRQYALAVGGILVGLAAVRRWTTARS